MPGSVSGREKLFIALWEIGAPVSAICERMELTHREYVSAAARALRNQGTFLERRGAGWSPPDGWQERLDGLLDED